MKLLHFYLGLFEMFFCRKIFFIAIILLFFNDAISQELSQTVKNQLWEYEDLYQYEQYGFFDFDIFYMDMINDTIISNIDNLFIQPHGLIICKFYTLLPHDYAHLLVIYDSAYLIVNMRESLDKVVSKTSAFLCKYDTPQTEIWSQIIRLHYENRSVDFYDRPPNWSYDPLKNSIEE